MLKLLGAAAYMPRAVRFDFAYDQLWNGLSQAARVFCRIAIDPDKPPKPTLNELYGRVWANDRLIIKAFDKLSDEEKAEVLGFFTFEIHELTHHIDFLITPYGTNFHSKLFREFIAFQNVVPLLLNEDIPLPSGRWVDWNPQEQLQPAELYQSWKGLRDIMLTLEALGDGGMRPHADAIMPGWGDNTRPVSILNRTFRRVTVRGFLVTLGTTEDKNWYLGPATILETRAVVHCLRWIIHLLGNSERARGALLLYLDSFVDSNDYSILLDVLASGFGKRDFRDLAASTPVELLQMPLMIVDAACWYALQAPPPMPDCTAVRSSPVVRLIYALRYIVKCYQEEKTFASMADVLASMDAAEHAVDFDLCPIEDILQFSLKFVRHLKSMTPQITSAVFRSHFEYVLNVQEPHLARRLGKGYVSYVGMPENGHPIFGMSSDEEAHGLSFQDYTPDSKVGEWFTFRHRLLYMNSNSDQVRSELVRYFGPKPA